MNTTGSMGKHRLEGVQVLRWRSSWRSHLLLGGVTLVFGCQDPAEPNLPDFPAGTYGATVHVRALEKVGEGELTEAEVDQDLAVVMEPVYFTFEQTEPYCYPDAEDGISPYVDLCAFEGPGFVMTLDPDATYPSYPGGVVMGVATELEILGWQNVTTVTNSSVVVPPATSDSEAAPTAPPEETPTPGDETPTPAEPTPTEEPTPQEVTCLRTVAHQVYGQFLQVDGVLTQVEIYDQTECSDKAGQPLPTLYHWRYWLGEGTLTLVP